jgi:hypothetical protein
MQRRAGQHFYHRLSSSPARRLSSEMNYHGINALGMPCRAAMIPRGGQTPQTPARILSRKAGWHAHCGANQAGSH